MQAAEGHITCDVCRLLLNGPPLHGKEPMSRISFRSLVRRRGPSNQASSKTFMANMFECYGLTFQLLTRENGGAKRN